MVDDVLEVTDDWSKTLRLMKEAENYFRGSSGRGPGSEHASAATSGHLCLVRPGQVWPGCLLDLCPLEQLCERFTFCFMSLAASAPPDACQPMSGAENPHTVKSRKIESHTHTHTHQYISQNQISSFCLPHPLGARVSPPLPG